MHKPRHPDLVGMSFLITFYIIKTKTPKLPFRFSSKFQLSQLRPFPSKLPRLRRLPSALQLCQSPSRPLPFEYSPGCREFCAFSALMSGTGCKKEFRIPKRTLTQHVCGIILTPWYPVLPAHIREHEQLATQPRNSIAD